MTDSDNSQYGQQNRVCVLNQRTAARDSKVPADWLEPYFLDDAKRLTTPGDPSRSGGVPRVCWRLGGRRPTTILGPGGRFPAPMQAAGGAIGLPILPPPNSVHVKAQDEI